VNSVSFVHREPSEGMDFVPGDRGFGWCNEPKFHLFPSHLQNRDADAIADDELFTPACG
jgi:hypothetical protein